MLSISKSVRLTKSQDGGILLDVDRGAIFSLNVVGTRIVELLQQQQSRSSLLRQVSCEFDVSEAAAAADLDEFLSTLRKQELLDAGAA
jgi:coenzyme PQQ synthesis protein D (PqqD)